MAESSPSEFAEHNPELDGLIARCAFALGDIERLRTETDALRALSGRKAELAAALFDLERARRGDPEARYDLPKICGTLLTFWRDGSGSAHAHGSASLEPLWKGAGELIAAFEKSLQPSAPEAAPPNAPVSAAPEPATPGPTAPIDAPPTAVTPSVEAADDIDLDEADEAPPPAPVAPPAAIPPPPPPMSPLDIALEQCFRTRTEKDVLAEAMKLLSPEGDDRVEFALCLYYLELARLGVAGAKQEFASRVGLVRDAYFSDELSSTLIGGDEGLKALWKDLVPYLDEFFEASIEIEPLNTGELQIVNLPSDGAGRPSPAAARPPPLPPPPAPPDDEEEPEVLEGSELVEIPAPPAFEGVEPTPEEERFWRYTEKALGILGNPDVGQPPAGAFSTEGRGEKKRLSTYLDTLPAEFLKVGSGRAFACLLRFYIANHVKEKTLFGAPNPKRQEAFIQALKLLSGDSRAAGSAAVWFQLDGPDTIAGLLQSLDVLKEYLAFCLRSNQDPLDEKVPERFFQVQP